MRSISAVLRMTREQLEARGQLGHQPVYAAAFLGVTGIALVAATLVPRTMRQQALIVSGALAFMALAFTFGAVSKRHVMKRNLAQEREIRACAVEALEKLMAHDPKLKPLTREQVDTLKELRKKQGPSPAIDRLLES